MIALVVVVAHKSGDCLLEVGRHLVGDLVNVLLDSLVIALQLAVGLRVEGCCQDVPDAHQVQVVPEGTGDVAAVSSRGIARMYAARFESAIEDFEAILGIEPGHAAARGARELARETLEMRGRADVSARCPHFRDVEAGR